MSTPYGDPSAPIAVGDVGGTAVAFLPRHGKGHEFPPHRINYRANIWALRSLGVEQVLAPCAVGGLQPETQPATLVVPDQLVDRTTRARPDLRRQRRRARTVRRSLLPRPARRAGRRRRRRRDRRRHDGRDRGAAVLHARRVAELCAGGVDGRQHDRPPRGGPRPRAGRSATPPSRWSPTSTPASARRSRSTRRRCSRCSRSTSAGSRTCSADVVGDARRCRSTAAAPTGSPT